MIVYHPGRKAESQRPSHNLEVMPRALTLPGRWHVGFAFSLAGSVLPKAMLWGIPSGILAVGTLGCSVGGQG